MLQIQVLHKTKDGRKIVQIPTKDKKTLITFDEDAFTELLALGIHPVFSLKQGTVWTRGRKKERYAPTTNVAVARILLDCDKGQMIRYLDNDCTNLCMSNLIMMNGMSIYKARDYIDKRFPSRRYELLHVYEDQEVAA